MRAAGRASRAAADRWQGRTSGPRSLEEIVRRSCHRHGRRASRQSGGNRCRAAALCWVFGRTGRRTAQPWDTSMYFQALASDYDGTLAKDGRVDAATVEALERLRATGRRTILVTGRELDDLAVTFDRL